MFKLRIYCNDGKGKQYWEDGMEEYETYDKALNACHENALQEVQGLMETSDYDNWFEVNTNFEITEAYKNKVLENVVFFPIAVIHYDKAPWDRENDCDIEIITGYDIIEVKSNINKNINMKIETKEVNNKKIIAKVDEEDNSIDIAVMIHGEPPVTLNVSVDDDKALIRKWIGYGDSEDEEIYLDELYE